MSDLLEKGMLPAQDFNYKTVDFSSFQGGSKAGKNGNADAAIFLQKKVSNFNVYFP